MHVLLNTCSFVMQVAYSQAYSPACERDHLTSKYTNLVPRLKEPGNEVVNIHGQPISFPEPVILGKEREALG